MKVSKPEEDFQFIAGNVALDFVNTVGNRLGNSREMLPTAAEFNRWSKLAGLLRKNVRLTITDYQLRDIRKTREELYRLFHSIASGSQISTRHLRELNLRLSSVASKHRLGLEKGAVVWEWEPATNDPASVLGPILLSAAELLSSGLFHKIRECNGEMCGWLFLDCSQAGKRRWCSMRDCGNRSKVRAFYNRQKNEGFM